MVICVSRKEETLQNIITENNRQIRGLEKKVRDHEQQMEKYDNLVQEREQDREELSSLRKKYDDLLEKYTKLMNSTASRMRHEDNARVNEIAEEASFFTSGGIVLQRVGVTGKIKERTLKFDDVQQIAVLLNLRLQVKRISLEHAVEVRDYRLQRHFSSSSFLASSFSSANRNE